MDEKTLVMMVFSMWVPVRKVVHINSTMAPSNSRLYNPRLFFLAMRLFRKKYQY
jgi:hypothetical protein